jgi:membrane protein YdbS with pleckstrin-like domain
VGEIKARPEKGQRTVWYIHWSLLFFPIFICMIILLILDPIIVGICILAWALFMLPFLLWIPAYFNSLEYSIADDAVKGQRGVFFKRYVSMPYHKITNVDITHGPLQRKFGVGHIHCQTAGAGGQQGARAELKMEGIRDLEGLKEAIMARVKGSAVVGTEAVRPRTATTDEPDIQGQMLKELRAIRGALEKKGDS